MKTLILLNGKDEPVQEFVPLSSYNELKQLYRFTLDKVNELLNHLLSTAPYTGAAFYFDEDRFREFQRLCQQLRLNLQNRESSFGEESMH